MYITIKRRKSLITMKSLINKIKHYWIKLQQKICQHLFIHDYLKYHDFGESLSVDSLKPLLDFEYIKSNPRYDFNNLLLEKYQKPFIVQHHIFQRLHLGKYYGTGI